jgi:lipid-A-disaccharide synthase
MLEAAERILQAKPSTQFLIPAATDAVEPGLRQLAGASGLPVTVLRGQSQLAMTASEVVVLASGTATLEAALLKKPMVITYKVPALTAWMAKRKLYLPYVGLPNILLGRFAVPELLQENATAEKLASAVLDWLDDPERCTSLKTEFGTLHATLRCNAGARIAEALKPYLS